MAEQNASLSLSSSGSKHFFLETTQTFSWCLPDTLGSCLSQARSAEDEAQQQQAAVDELVDSMIMLNTASRIINVANALALYD